MEKFSSDTDHISLTESHPDALKKKNLNLCCDFY